ncbi:MAG: hypothetical protein MJY61_04805 [Bacteroidales bacterium]|nr:hypothetical protein [Bacteroidales bacterium]
MKLKGSDIVSIFLVLLILAGLAAVCSLDGRERSKMNCRAVKLSIDEPFRLIEDEQVMLRIREDYGECVGRKLDELDLSAIEKTLDGSGVVLKSQVWTTPDAVLHISLKQRTPVVRFLKDGGCFYSDRDGHLFKASRRCSLDLPVIDGDLPIEFGGELPTEDGAESEKKRWLMQTLDMLETMKDTPWEENVTQISVLPGGDMVMVPREGTELFLFGRPDGAADKFERMGKYYTHILPAKGEGYYRKVSVKYKGQIICTK